MASLPRSCRLAASRVSSTSSSGSPSRAGHARGELGDALRVAARVDVARVDRPGEARGGAEARGAVGAAREPLQLGELDHVRPVGADAVLAVLLRPVERAVGQADQLVAVARVRRRGRDAHADRDRADLLELQRGDPLDDRRRRGQRAVLVVAGQEQRELVAAEPERLAGLAQPRREPREHAVAGRVAEAVVDPLEVVDVDEAERERETPSPERAVAPARAVRGNAGGCRAPSAGRSARAASRAARGRSSAGRAGSRAAGRRAQPRGTASAPRGPPASAPPRPSARRGRS